MAIVVLSTTEKVRAQQSSESGKDVKPGMAFVRSALLPGWGHHYVKPDNWRRGKYHMIAEGVLLATYLGFDMRSSYMDERLTTMAKSFADANLDLHERSYELAVGRYDNLGEYNKAQLEKRNWNELFPDSPKYVWNWDSEAKRNDFRNIRDTRDRLERQLPGLLSLMVLNRIISGISAYNWAKELLSDGTESNEDDYFSDESIFHKIRNRTSLRVLPMELAEPELSTIGGPQDGYMARFKYHF